MKDRFLEYLRKEISKPEQIVSSSEAAEHLKQKHNEYQRRESGAFEKHIKNVIETIFAEVNSTNIRKSFYKKRDLIASL